MLVGFPTLQTEDIRTYTNFRVAVVMESGKWFSMELTTIYC